MKINVAIPDTVDVQTRYILREIQNQANIAIAELKKEIQNLRSANNDS